MLASRRPKRPPSRVDGSQIANLAGPLQRSSRDWAFFGRMNSQLTDRLAREFLSERGPFAPAAHKLAGADFAPDVHSTYCSIHFHKRGERLSHVMSAPSPRARRRSAHDGVVPRIIVACATRARVREAGHCSERRVLPEVVGVLELHTHARTHSRSQSAPGPCAQAHERGAPGPPRRSSSRR